MVTVDKKELFVWAVAALLAVALVSTLAVTAVLHVSGVWSPLSGEPLVNRNAPAYSAPVSAPYVAPRGNPLAPQTNPLADWQKEQRQASCDQQWRAYQAQYNTYLDNKGSPGGFALAPSKPWC